MVKSYLRYQFKGHFGLVTSCDAGSVLDQSGTTVLTGANEFVYGWNFRTSEILFQLRESGDDFDISHNTVTCLKRHPLDANTIAVSYANGSVRLWNIASRSVLSTFRGHQSGVSVLEFSLDGHLLFSGGYDTDIVVWDITSRVGLYRLQGHTNQITALRCLHTTTLTVSENTPESSSTADKGVDPGSQVSAKSRKRRAIRSKERSDTLTRDSTTESSVDSSNRFPFTVFSRTATYLVSGSKDGTVKLWDLSTQWCVQTVFDPSGEVWSISVNPTETRVIVGSSDHQLKFYALSNQGPVVFSETEDAVSEQRTASGETTSGLLTLQLLGSISRPSGRSRITQLFHVVDAESLVSEYKKQSIADASHFASDSIITPYGTMLTNRDSHIASSATRQLILALVPGKKTIEVYREYTVAERVHRRGKRIRRAHEKLKKKMKKLQELNALCESLEKEVGQGKRTAIGTTFDAEREAALRQLELLNLELEELKTETQSHTSFHVADEFQYIYTFYLKQKPTALDYSQLTWSLLLSFNDHAFQLFRLPVDKLFQLKGPASRADIIEEEKSAEENEIVLGHTAHRVSSGHAGALRSLFVSHDDAMIATLSEKNLHVWNADSLRHIRHIELLDSLTCGFFVAGNTHVVLGSSAGSIVIADVTSCHVTERLPNAHQGAVRAIAEHPKKTGFATTGSDKTVKFFQFTVVEEKSDAFTAVELVKCELLASYSLPDEGLDVKFTYCGKLVAVALLDFTIQVFFTDTMKLFLTLYGHRLPCTSIDISSDNTILASGSCDKTIKIWGLDFGNIQKSWHAHDEDVTQVKFLKDTHYLVSSAKNGEIKLWDTDRRDLICQLQARSSPVVSIATTRIDSDRIIVGARDGSVRVWGRTEEQLFAEEEKEKLLEGKLDKEAARADLGIIGAPEVMMSRATRKTVASVKTTEQLMEAIDLCSEALKDIANYKESVQTWISEYGDTSTSSAAVLTKLVRPAPRAQLLGLSPHHYLYTAISQIPSALQHEVVVALPFSFAERLLSFLGDILEACETGSSDVPLGMTGATEAIARIALLIVHLHARQFIAFPSYRGCLMKLYQYLRPRLMREKDTLEMNKSALELLQKTVHESKCIALA